jgi:hypothetical protein
MAYHLSFGTIKLKHLRISVHFRHSLHYHITTRNRSASLCAIQGFLFSRARGLFGLRPDIRRRLGTQKRRRDSLSRERIHGDGQRHGD